MEYLENNMLNSKINIKNSKELEFAVFCIENIANKLQADTTQVYDLLVNSNILYGYIIPEYEVLHTQSKEYIVEELLEIMKGRGIAL